MSSTLTRSRSRLSAAPSARLAPPEAPAPPPRPPEPPRSPVSDDVLTLALVLLVAAALVPLQRVYIGSDWIRPVVGAAALSLGIGWGARRLGVGPITHLLMTLAGLVVFVTIAFLPTTAAGGILPTADTLVAIKDLFIRGLELVRLRPSPTFAEAGLLLLTVGGVWIVSYLADGMLFVLRSPLKAVIAAVALWTVPLAVAPQGSIVTPSVPLLAASAVLLLLGNAASSAAYGVAVTPSDGSRRPPVVPVSGWFMAAVVVLIGVLLARGLPGFGQAPVYEIRGSSGTTITTNPLVNLQPRLVAQNTGPVMHVTVDRPVYLRTTALDVYNDREEWGLSAPISGFEVHGQVDNPPAIPVELIDVQVGIDGIESGSILAPTPFQTINVGGDKSGVMRYDPGTATLTVQEGHPLVRGDTYVVTAALPQPDVDALRQVPFPAANAFTLLPSTVPAIAAQLAQEIVTTAGAATMFDQALAVQERLRTWSYSTQPTFGPGETALEQFINGREGYCEQYAGTMAILLRTLGIPTRLAVGYTPGTERSEGLWEVTNANAHAWVEVNFGELGWIPFEPTPRSDGNVLVPSAAGVIPTQTLSQQGAAAPNPAPTPSGLPGGLEDEQPAPDVSGTPFAVPDGTPGAADGEGGSGLLLVVLVLLAAGLVAAPLVLRQRHRGHTGSPERRIERARQELEHVGAAVGRRRDPAETDREYFTRLSAGHPSGLALADPATRVDYAPAVTEEHAKAAEAAAATLRQRLTVPLPARTRLLVELRTYLPRLRTR